MAARAQQISGHLSSQGGLLAGQVALITGSGQGIGASAAKIFAREGAQVIVTDIDGNKAQNVVNEIKAEGGDAFPIAGDIMKADFPQKLVEESIKKYGKLNVIVNNAGFTYDGVIHKMSDDQWNTMITVHNTAPFRTIRAVAPYWRKKDGQLKSIINISSTSGLHGNFGQINYATAKMGVVGFTKTICKEWGGFGVRANTIAFGYIRTRLTAGKELGETILVDGKAVAIGIPGKMSKEDPKALADIPLQRAGDPDEAASAILFLACPLSSYISGHTLEVTGGTGI